jgi:hypothetical protein
MTSDDTWDDLDGVAQWIEDDAVGEDDQVREFAASVAARIRDRAREDVSPIERGYQRAIEHLRDGETFMVWYRSRRRMSDRTYAEVAAEYLTSRRRGWPSGGKPAGGFQTCAGCGDDIWPNEQTYPADASGDTSEAAGVQCLVCEVRTRRTEGSSRGE